MNDGATPTPPGAVSSPPPTPPPAIPPTSRGPAVSPDPSVTGKPASRLLDLVNAYSSKSLEFPQLKGITLAQWILKLGVGLLNSLLDTITMVELNIETRCLTSPQKSYTSPMTAKITIVPSKP